MGLGGMQNGQWNSRYPWCGGKSSGRSWEAGKKHNRHQGSFLAVLYFLESSSAWLRLPLVSYQHLSQQLDVSLLLGTRVQQKPLNHAALIDNNLSVTMSKVNI